MIKFSYFFVFSILFVANLSQTERMVGQTIRKSTSFVLKPQPNSQSNALLTKEKKAGPLKVPP
jgi:hypothetical protein